MRKSLLITANGHQPSFVISQPWWTAMDQKSPHPSDNEIDDFMQNVGFTKQQKSYFGWIKEDIVIIDARVDNFIKTIEGVVPVDLVICRS